MKRVIRQVAVIARRDFLAIVATPTFLLFLLAPAFMLAFGAVGGTGAARMGASAANNTRIVAIADGRTVDRLKAGDAALRSLFRGDEGPPALKIMTPQADVERQAKALLAGNAFDVTAVMRGPLTAPRIDYNAPSERHATYLGALADLVVREQASGVALDKAIVRPTITTAREVASSKRGQQVAGFGAVFVIFFLTLLLAGQAVGMLTEEKSNKVIEILAAAVPLEAVFLGKLIGLFGVAALFVAFWLGLGSVGFSLLPREVVLTGLAPAIGLPTFLILCVLYFSMAYLLLGAVFLGVGAQASTMREIQMLSLPITIFQVAMFGLASAAAAEPGSRLARIAELFPFSSPFAMAARGATDPALWPHLLALAWQALWVVLTIVISVRLFRIGVLKSGGSAWRALLGLKRAG